MISDCHDTITVAKRIRYNDIITIPIDIWREKNAPHQVCNFVYCVFRLFYQ